MLIVLVMLLAGDGEIPARMDWESPRAEVPLLDLQSGHWHLGLAASAQARVSIPFGTADPGVVRVNGNVITIDHRVDYLDLFNPGLGVTLEADVLSRPPDRPAYARETALGGYVAAECAERGHIRLVEAADHMSLCRRVGSTGPSEMAFLHHTFSRRGVCICCAAAGGRCRLTASHHLILSGTPERTFRLLLAP